MPRQPYSPPRKERPCPNGNCTGMMRPRRRDPLVYDAVVYECTTCGEVEVIKVSGAP